MSPDLAIAGRQFGDLLRFLTLLEALFPGFYTFLFGTLRLRRTAVLDVGGLPLVAVVISGRLPLGFFHRGQHVLLGLGIFQAHSLAPHRTERGNDIGKRR